MLETNPQIDPARSIDYYLSILKGLGLFPKIVLTVGSFSYGLQNADSDLDIFIIYSRPPELYGVPYELVSSFETQNQTLKEVKLNNVEFQGWDLKKFIRLLSESNRRAWELARLGVLDSVESVLEGKTLLHRVCYPMHQYIDFAKLIRSYLGEARQRGGTAYNCGMGLKDQLFIKEALNALRGVLSAFHILTHQALPPPKIFNKLEGFDLNPEELVLIQRILEMNQNPQNAFRYSKEVRKQLVKPFALLLDKLTTNTENFLKAADLSQREFTEEEFCKINTHYQTVREGFYPSSS